MIPFLRRPFLCALLALSLPLLSCSKSAKGGGKGGFQMPPTPVEVAEVHPQRVRDEFHALGNVDAAENIQVVSEINGVVRALPFKEGGQVARGALLVQLDDGQLRATSDRAAAQRSQASANAERASKLAAQNVISSQQLEDARTALAVSDADAALARSTLSKTRIRAPFSGLVGRRRVSPGAYVKAGDLITELARVDELKVTFTAPERYAGLIKPGVPVELNSPAFPGQTFIGRVTVVDPIIDPDTRTVQLVARVPNPGRRLKPGMSANVTVALSERDDALMVPDEAVFAEGSQSYVYVVKADSTVARTAIQLGTRDSARVEVVRGLEPGQRVVSAGHQKLYEGAHVMPVPEAAQNGDAAAADTAGGHAAKAGARTGQ